MTRSQRQLVVLGALAVAAVGLWSWRMNIPDAPSSPGVVQQSGAQSSDVAGTPQLEIALDRLTARASAPPTAERNPFRFRPRPAPAPRVVPMTRAEPTQPLPPPGPPPPPPIPLKFIGLIDAPARVGRLAILSDSRGGVFYGKEGDTIEGRYRVLSVSNESAELVYMDGRGRQTIRLSGQ